MQTSLHPVALPLLLLLLPVPTLVREASAQQTTRELWPELDAYVHLTSSTRLFFLFAPVRSEDAESFSEAQLGAHIEAGLAPMSRKRRIPADDPDKLRYLRFRFGYRQAFTQDTVGRDLSERRVIAELTPRFFLPWNVLVALRNRLDFRWLEGDYSWRYRPRLWIERESVIAHVTFVPYLSAEVFYDSRYDSWARTRYQAGLAVPATRWLVPEAYYSRQTDRQPASKRTDALGLLATLYF
jgi:hypothetical protein